MRPQSSKGLPVVRPGCHDEATRSVEGLTVLAEPTAECNLACTYCYKGPKPSRRMSLGTARRMLDEVVRHNNAMNAPTPIVWHGGEPTLVGASFYRDIFSYAASLSSKFPVRHTMQTNGTLLDEALLDVFGEYKVSIGVSLDGPPDYHDSVRPTRGGKPTYHRIVDGLERAKEHGIDVGILMSIGRDNAEFVREMFSFCRERDFALGLNPITRDFHALHGDTEVQPTAYLEACKLVFDLWFYQKEKPIQVNPGFGIVRHLVSRAQLSDCSMCDNCQYHFISVGPEGDVYPCNRFYGLDQYRFGNIRSTPLPELLASRVRKTLLTRTASTIERCQGCSIRGFCNGGCMHHALAHFNALDSPDHLCEVYQGLVHHAIHRLSEVV